MLEQFPMATNVSTTALLLYDIYAQIYKNIILRPVSTCSKITGISCKILL